MQCDYGCGQEANYTLKNGKNCCCKSPNSCPVNREKNSKAIKRAHDDGRIPAWGGNIPNWNKGLTKETDERIKKGIKTYKERIKSGRIIPWQCNNSLSDEHKKAISEGMKKAHIEGKAWNIGMSRWNNEPSYPEKFFMKVIKNEFEDKDYQREFPFGIYSFDFAWPHLMKAIEIDGEQHERFIEYKERDQRKDIYAAENGWKVLRISWKEFYNDTKYWIQISKNFIGREAA